MGQDFVALMIDHNCQVERELLLLLHTAGWKACVWEYFTSLPSTLMSIKALQEETLNFQACQS